jgi:uncharacterized RDD family membrane protein YckC/ABC-type transport system involved in multi-copper enzyme maturation permease subunit
MSGIGSALRLGGGRVGRGFGHFWAGINAVGIKELRGRMRGRRAFAIVTVYLLLLSLFALAIYTYLKQQAATQSAIPFDGGFRGEFFPGQFIEGGGTALSAGIGHGLFGGLLLVETLLIVVLAPALTSGAISLEREKQTLDLLVTTPLSTLGMVIGKLVSALSYVFLLIIASIPLASLVFVFGAVGPDDLVRGYVVLFALAFGMGALGLFISALVKRTQTATVVTFVVVLVLVIGTVGLHQFWMVATQPRQTNVFGNPLTNRPGKAPEAVLWMNPLVADLDLICTTAPGAYHPACSYMSTVTGKPYFGNQFQNQGFDDFGGRFGGPVAVPAGGTNATSIGFPRDTFWPKSAITFVLIGVLLTLVSAQLVSPTRRLRVFRRTGDEVEIGPAPGMRYAPHFQRLLAAIIDSLITSAVWLAAAVGVLFGAPIASLPVIVILTLLYYPLFWARGGQTPGMKPFGLYVVRASDGGRLGVRRALLRVFGYLISSAALAIGFVWIIIESRRRGWHDLISGSAVVKREADAAVADTSATASIDALAEAEESPA